MAYDSDRGFAPREMIKGNWKCSDCGAEITELPFEPAADRPITAKSAGQKEDPKEISADNPKPPTIIWWGVSFFVSK